MTNWPSLPESFRVERLTPPARRPVPCVLDTDTYNEIDDQFCLAWAALSPDIDLKAVYAAPFFNDRSVGPADGMEKSYREIIKLYELMGLAHEGLVLRGADRYMSGPEDPVDSPAARDLIERAMRRPDDDPLYVLAIGCPVNVSSALLLEPRIAQKIVVVWLGGNPVGWPTAKEFNLQQDIHAPRVLFDSGVPLVLIPCQQVTTHLATTIPELEYFLRESSPVGRYLYENTRDYILHYAGKSPGRKALSKVIWDITAVAWCLMPGTMPSKLIPSPMLSDTLHWGSDPTRHLIREVFMVHRDPIFTELFSALNRG
ncbi:MAG: nucleoside hydrolase [Christensenellales bacterium]|jgi:purine nucleosidase